MRYEAVIVALVMPVVAIGAALAFWWVTRPGREYDRYDNEGQPNDE